MYIQNRPMHVVVLACGVASCATSASLGNPVQWRIEDGGNGHWYAVHDLGPTSWTAASAYASAAGGYLATITSHAEGTLVAAIRTSSRSTILGGFQDGGDEPDGGWQWVTGEPWSFTRWAPAEPNNAGGQEHFLYFASTGTVGDLWNDGSAFCGVCEAPLVAIEYEFQPNVCDSVDFNNEGLFPDTADIDDFLSVFSGGPCSTGMCGDVDFNNDGLFPDTQDIDSLLSVFSGGPCL